MSVQLIESPTRAANPKYVATGYWNLRILCADNVVRKVDGVKLLAGNDVHVALTTRLVAINEIVNETERKAAMVEFVAEKLLFDYNPVGTTQDIAI